jgi:MFS family permease
MFSSLSVRNFRIYWFGMFVSLIGTWIQVVAQSWLVFELTKSAFLLGVVGFLSSIPVFLLSLFGGVLADRRNKRNILIATQTTFMFLAFLLAVLTQMKIITPGEIMFIALLNGVVMAFDAPSRQAVVVELVGKDNLFNAIALNSVAFNSSRIIGPALAGVLVAVIGMSGCFYLNGISFLAVIIALFLIHSAAFNPRPLGRGKNAPPSVSILSKPRSLDGGVEGLIKTRNHSRGDKNNTALKDLKDGLIFVKNNRLILALITVVGIVSLFGIAYVILMPIFANEVLKVGARGLGVLMSSSGLGALAGALLLARLGDFKYKGKLLFLSSLVFSLSLILFSLSKIYLLSIITLMFIGCSSVTAIAIINTILQTRVSDEYRGRVMSVFMLTFAGMMPFGNLISGSLAQAFGVSFAVLVNGIICAVFLAVINIAYPKIRNI